MACVLLMLSFSISGNATDFSTCISSCESTCQFSESSSDNTNHRSSVGGHHVDYDNTQSLSISDVELGFPKRILIIVCVESLKLMTL